MRDWNPIILNTITTPLLSVLCLSLIRWQYDVLLFHTLAELFSVIVGILMMVIVWNTRSFTQNNFYLYLGIGYFWIAILDAWHAFTFTEMPFFDIINTEVTLHFWIYTRLIEALLLLTALLFIKIRLNARLMMYLGAGLTLLVVWASFTLNEPVLITSEGLTAFKVNTEYFIIFLLTIAFFAYIRLREHLAPKVFYFLLASLILTIFAELSFTLYTDFHGHAFVAGHLFKFLSFWMIYQAIVQTTLIEPFTALAASSSSYNAIPHPAVIVDNQCMISQINRAAEEYIGKPSHHLIHKPVHEFFHPDNVAEENCELCQAIKQGRSMHSYFAPFSEKAQWFLVSLAPIKAGDNTSGMVQLLTDITEQIRTKDRIRTLSQAVEQSPISVIITDTNSKIEYVNRAFEKITGYSSAEVIGENPSLLQSGKTPAYIYKEMWQTIESGKSWQGELVNIRKNGEIFYEQANIAPVYDESGTICHYLAFKEDITLRKQQEERMLHQAHFDALTDLPNRFLALDRLTQLLNEAQRKNEKVAVLFLDLDDFKKVNDSLGHETGDKLLIEASERLRSVARSGDTVGRLGGDEFIVLLGGLADAADARPVAENLLNRFRDAFKINGRELILTISLGIAIFPEDGDNTSELLRNADSAMYHSKNLGRNTYSYFTDAMNREVSRRLALEEQIHGALDRDEFTVLYQPQIEISSGKIIGAEALLRWHNPALGDVSPNEFIPIAEQTGMIVLLGKFVLMEALGTVAKWQQEHDPKLRIAVNLSPLQFRDPELVGFIEKTIKQAGLTGKSLELEITEGVLMSGHSYIDDALAALHNLGISLAMDDFGVGYSSLSYLRNYPFDVLKIDRSFVNDISEDRADRELISAAIAMAHSLNLKVVAEGVETEEQLAYLKQLNCDYGQGYLFGKPGPAEKITEMLNSI